MSSGNSDNLSNSDRLAVSEKLERLIVELDACEERWRDWNYADLASYDAGGTGHGLQTNLAFLKEYEKTKERLTEQIAECKKQLLI